MPSLYLVATPIGNLEDITLRALRILAEVELIAAEDTRHARRLLQRYDLHTRCISYHEHNKLARLDEILATLADHDVALISDAGTPAISDPGFELVRACIDAGFPVVPLPGPSAPISALVASGLATDRFLSLGFLPRRSQERRALFAEIIRLHASIVCFEAPHRLQDMLQDALEVLGDRRIAVAKDISKLHELMLRGTISTAQAYFAEHAPRGEFTVVFAGNDNVARRKADQQNLFVPAEAQQVATDDTAAQRLRELRAAGYNGSRAARIVARELGLDKSRVYQIWLDIAE
jgi:16S rRNA (cytidine1402-2'-O)-methyltransferase